MHRSNGRGQQLVESPLCTATLRWGSREWNLCNAMPDCLWAVGSGFVAMHRLTAWGQWVVEHPLCTATLAGSGTFAAQCLAACGICCNVLPHCVGAVGSATSALHCHTARKQWAVELLLCSA